MTVDDTSAARKRAIRHLRQFVEALDRRVPQIMRAGETKIAADAADLKARALKRLKALEGPD